MTSARRVVGDIGLLLAERSLLGSIKQIVAVEVRYRKTNACGSAAESVGAGKRRRLIAATQQYMSEHPQTADIAWRFDVVAVSGDLPSSPLTEWIPNAFEVC
jgi:putative endonuclease